MISTKCIVESAKVMWIKRFCNSVEAKWKKLALNLMGIEKSMLNRKQLLKDILKKAKTNFYADLLTVWFSVINANVRSVSDLLDENIFDNPLFLIDNKMLNVKSNNWTDAGILKVSDVWNDNTNTFISKSDLEKVHKITISDITSNQIVSALAFQIKKFLKIKNDCFIFNL